MDELPPLPDAAFTYERHPGGIHEPERVGAYTADQMRAYAAAAVAQYKNDAERYRWLRTFEVDSYLACGKEEKLDAEIDLAMSKG